MAETSHVHQSVERSPDEAAVASSLAHPNDARLKEVARWRVFEVAALNALDEAASNLVKLGETPSNRTVEPLDALLNAREAAEYVGCHPNTIYQAAHAGDLRPHRVGRRSLRFTRADLLAWTGARS